MQLPFDVKYQARKIIKTQKQKQNTTNNTKASSTRLLNSDLHYNMVSVHIDRINITHVAELHHKSKHQIIKSDDAESSSVVKEKRQIKYTIDNKLSQPSIRKIQKAVKYLNFITVPKKLNNPTTGKDFNFKLCFATFTLSSPQMHSDQVLKNMLINQLIIELKKKYSVKNYVWRLEKQNNGNAHFHFILDKFIPHQELRELWNRIQNKLGYVDEYTKKMSVISYKDYQQLFKNSKKATTESIRKSYAKGKATSWKYPNSTDVHSLLFILDIDKYLIKYMSKSEQNEGIEGRLWGCSQALSNITGGREIVDSNINIELNRLIENKAVRHVKSDYYEILFLDWFILEKCECYILMSLLREFLITHFDLKT
jgi:hypothetical protein